MPFLKNYWEISTNCSWYGCTKGSKIFLAACIESVIIMIQLTWERYVAWIIPHLIAKSLASIDVTLTTWCIVWYVICQVHSSEKHISAVHFLSTNKAYLL